MAENEVNGKTCFQMIVLSGISTCATGLRLFSRIVYFFPFAQIRGNSRLKLSTLYSSDAPLAIAVVENPGLTPHQLIEKLCPLAV
jgi:hypothetical protein